MVQLPDLIEWHEGMLLTPQHFQQFAGRSELLTQVMFACDGSFRWGLIDLKIDQAALNSGTLRILNIEAILPDGLLIMGGSEHGFELNYDLQKAESNPARIYLVVPRESALYARSDYSRYEGYAGTDALVTDGVSNGAPGPIPRIRPRMKLVTGPTNLAGMTALPILEFSGSGAVSQQTDYIAPVLRIRSGSPLAEFCAPMRRLVREKATELANRLHKTTPGEPGNDATAIQQLQALVSALPLVEALLDCEQTHPFTLYRALCSMAGTLAFLSHRKVPEVFRPYNHDELRATFGQVLGFIELAITEGLVENWFGRPLKLRTELLPGRGSAAFELGETLEQAFAGDADFSAPYMGLMLRGPAEIMTEWGKSCLLASEEAIPILEMSRSQGAVCELVESLDGLTAEPGSVLFRVKNEPQWLDPRRKLVLKAARQETRTPDAATLFLKKRAASNQDG
jgi:type VI secretion system protein ImpJ